jgi:sugar phosphate isomerase/epimerase
MKRFSGRILGTHLHDALGFHDHRSPGEGEMDFRKIASYLPPAAFRTLEIQSYHSVEQVKKGLENLAAAGCIHLQ